MKEDCLYIELGSENKYIINATINEKSYELTPSKTINSLGNFSPNRPITLNLLDLDRNNIKEIIVQSSEENSSIQHLFKWTGNGGFGCNAIIWIIILATLCGGFGNNGGNNNCNGFLGNCGC